jgi:hypothetical protein
MYRLYVFAGGPPNTMKKRTRRHAKNASKCPKEIISVEVLAYIASLDCKPHHGANRRMRCAQEPSNAPLSIAVLVHMR